MSGDTDTKASHSLRPAGPPLMTDGSWNRAESLLLATLAHQGEHDAALSVVEPLREDAVRAVMLQAGFRSHLNGDRDKLLGGLRFDLVRATESGRAGLVSAKAPVVKLVTSNSADLPPAFASALEIIQSVFGAPNVEVGLAGSASIADRASVRFVTGKAVQNRIVGFEVDGLSGKFKLPANIEISDFKSLVAATTGDLAVSQVKKILPLWAAGKFDSKVSELVPESVARILRGSPSLEGVESITKALSSGLVKDFGSKHGLQVMSNILVDRGVRFDAPSVTQMVQDSGLKITEADRQRGQYVGPVVAVDHRTAAVKWSRDSVLLVPHKDLPLDKDRLEKGDFVKLRYVKNELTVTVQPKVIEKERVGRGH